MHDLYKNWGSFKKGGYLLALLVGGSLLSAQSCEGSSCSACAPNFEACLSTCGTFDQLCTNHCFNIYQQCNATCVP